MPHWRSVTQRTRQLTGHREFELGLLQWKRCDVASCAKVVSERLSYAKVCVAPDVYSRLLPDMQGAIVLDMSQILTRDTEPTVRLRAACRVWLSNACSRRSLRKGLR